jgi:hypothetical protein
MRKRRASQNLMKSIRFYEKRMAKKHKGRYLGGPGQPDYIKGKIPGEVKAWSRPMSRYDVKKEIQKGRKEIISKSGFTSGAISYVKRYRPNVKLFHKNKRIA